MGTARLHDIIVYGATGFTGSLVATYLAQKRELPVERWALAGRNVRKLEAVRERLAAADPRFAALTIYQASAEDPESLADLAVRSRVVLTTVGPYLAHGKPLVAACVAAGTDYVDLTGEPAFWKGIIAEHHEAAQRSGALIVPCCGFDSIPHDLGAWLVAGALREVAERTHATIEIDGFVSASGLPSGGTWQSALGIMANAKPGDARSDGPRGKRRGLHFADDVKRWVLPMPTIDPMVVARSAVLDAYGQGFAYRAWLETKSRLAALQIVAGVATVATLAKVSVARRLLSRLRPAGSGPSESQRSRAWFRVKVVGRCGDAVATAIVSGGDPGYDETAKMISESALCLALDRASLPMRGGVVTPATAMGQHLVQRLRDAGMKLTIEGPDDARQRPATGSAPAA